MSITHAIRTQPDRLPAHRRGADRPVQLAAGPASRRPVHPSDRRHRPAAARRGCRPEDPRRVPLDRDRLGRRARKSAGRSARTSSRSGPSSIAQAAERLARSGHVYRDYSTDAERAADKAAAERDKRAYRFRRKPAHREQRPPSSRPRAARSPCGFRSRRAERWSSTT